MDKCKDFYILVSKTIREEWKCTTDGLDVSEIKWDDGEDEFEVTSGSGVRRYSYEDFFKTHTHRKNKRGYDPKSLIPSIVCLLNVLDIISNNNRTGAVRDGYLHKYVAERYDDVEYGLENNLNMEFLTENVREFLMLS